MIAGQTLTIQPIRKTFWWPHPYARPWLWKTLTMTYRYFINGVECDKYGVILPREGEIRWITDIWPNKDLEQYLGGKWVRVETVANPDSGVHHG